MFEIDSLGKSELQYEDHSRLPKRYLNAKISRIKMLSLLNDINLKREEGWIRGEIPGLLPPRVFKSLDRY